MIDYNLLTSEAEKIGVNLGEYGADRFDVYAERLVRIPTLQLLPNLTI